MCRNMEFGGAARSASRTGITGKTGQSWPFLGRRTPIWRPARGCRPRWPAFRRTDSTYNRVMPENDVPRRTFLRGMTAATALSYSRVYGANERVQLGLIGCGERGRSDMGKFVKSGTVDVVALCDIYAAQIDNAKKIAPNGKSF